MNGESFRLAEQRLCEAFGHTILSPGVIHIKFAVDRFRHRMKHVLNRGQEALCEFLRTPEEGDSAFFKEANMNVRDIAGDFYHGTALSSFMRLMLGEVWDFVKRLCDQQRRCLMQITRANDQIEHVARIDRVQPGRRFVEEHD